MSDCVTYDGLFLVEVTLSESVKSILEQARFIVRGVR